VNIQEQIKKYIISQPDPKRIDMQALHLIMLQTMPACKLWFLDGKDSEGKTVSNPNIGYGSHTIKYADGTTREFYQIGSSANKTRISAYILGIEDGSTRKLMEVLSLPPGTGRGGFTAHRQACRPKVGKSLVCRTSGIRKRTALFFLTV